MVVGGTTELARRATQRPATSGLLERLRGLDQPHHRRTWIIERQAELLLAEAGITEPMVPETVVRAIPLVHVRRWKGLPTSGMTSREHDGWQIILSADESPIRQRFTLLHELKHIIDDPHVDNAATHDSIAGPFSWAEHQANYFAACVLMPEQWIRNDWAYGLRDPQRLGRRYGVNARGARIRLSELGLIDTDDRWMSNLLARRHRHDHGAAL